MTPKVAVDHIDYLTVDTESASISLEELCSSVKEPEEADHAAKCHLLHDDKIDEAVSEISKDWSYILGHDKLKKRVRSALHGARQFSVKCRLILWLCFHCPQQ